jgi:1,3-beta-glucanosyltransferase GAS1
MCNSYQQLSFAMNAYVLDNKQASCDFSGNATTQTASTASACSSVLSAAGTAGTGSVTAVPTGAGGSGAGTGTGSSSAQSSSKSSAAGAMNVPQFDMGLLQLSVYVVAAVMAGAGMVLL